MKYFADGRTHPSAAYWDRDNEANASNFALYVLPRLACEWHISVSDTYDVLMRSSVLEDYILYYHNSLHQRAMSWIIEEVTRRTEAFMPKSDEGEIYEDCHDSPCVDGKMLREDRAGDVVAVISESRGILLSEAIGIFLQTPELEERLYNDPIEDVLADKYPSDLVQQYL